LKKVTLIMLSLLIAHICCLAADTPDTKGCKDHPMFTRMPGFWIHHCDEKQFDAHSFTVADGKTEQVEGKVTKISYYPQNSMQSKPSEIQILRNFENAVTAIGGSVVWSGKGKETLKVVKDSKEIWIEVGAEFTGKHGLTILEKGAMTQSIEANADFFSNGLKTSGHVAVYGIYFDTAKTDIKPESEAAITEIAKLLNADPSLKVFVVGHTDAVGGFESNMKLSQGRADAVVRALVEKHKIDAARLKACGAGPMATVALNDTDSGREKNRRVELVKQ
jgi:OmpA-OmpF porin, OOP family